MEHTIRIWPTGIHNCVISRYFRKVILTRTLAAKILSNLMPEMVWLLQTIASPTTSIPIDLVGFIPEEEFIAEYKVAKEATSSSPSGWHVSHYKTIVKDTNLVSLHTTMMSIPFQKELAPDRWAWVTDVALEKECCQRLWFLALFKSDFNHAKHLLVAWKIGHHIEDNNMPPNMQVGSHPGKNCHSTVLHKVLSHDIVHFTHQSTVAFIKNDAIGCYDRLMNNHFLLILLKLGLPTVYPIVWEIYGNIWRIISKLFMEHFK
jgi:hypothetical protein